MKRRSLTMVAIGALALGCGGSEPATDTTPKNPVAESGSETGPLQVTFRAVQDAGDSGGTQQPVAVGDTLRSGDKIALNVSVTRPAYVYVLQFFPDGSAAVLFPQSGENNRVSAEQRIPPSGWFQLDDVVGTENVYVVASAEPLERADQAVSSAIDDVQTTGRAPELPSADDPPVDPPDDVPEPAAPDAGVAAPPDPPSSPDAGAKKHGAGGPKRANKPKRKTKRPAREPPPPGGASLTSRGLHRTDSDKAVSITADEAGVAIYRFWFEHAARE